MAHRECRGDWTAPVLTEERDVCQVEVLCQCDQVLGVGLERVLTVLWSLGFAESHVVGDDHPMVFR